MSPGDTRTAICTSLPRVGSTVRVQAPRGDPAIAGMPSSIGLGVVREPARQHVSLPSTGQRKADRDVDRHYSQFSVAVRGGHEMVDGGAEVSPQVAVEADPALLQGVDIDHAGHESTSTVNWSPSRLTQNTVP